METLFIEAKLKPTENPTGKEWEITLIGAKSPGDVLTIGGERYVKSLNGRLYSVKALEASVPMWEGVKVYDNHLTPEEFDARMGMRSPVHEWLGTITAPRWDAQESKLKGTFKVVDPSLAEKLKMAHEQNVLESIGFSIDTFPIIGKELVYEGVSMPVIDGFKKIQSVDLVGDPAAGGGFERLIAAQTPARKLEKEIAMEKEEITKAIVDEVGKQLAALDIGNVVKSTLAEALAADEDETETTQEGETPEPEKVEPTESEAVKEAKLARCELQLERKLTAAKLPAAFEKPVREGFAGKIFDEKELDAMIANMKEAQASQDPSGQVDVAATNRIVEGLSAQDKFELEVQRIIMGNSAFRGLESANDDVKERLSESKSYQAWKKHGAQSVKSFGKLSHLLYDYFGGDPLINDRAYEAASTSSLATVVKNTVNIMVAADYSQREQWYAPLVTTEEVDTIDDATLARVYGVSTLSVVNEGAAYTELALADEEETASFVKKGNYVEITMETLMRDKINFIRRVPRVLSDSWHNTLSALVSGVFTVNTAAGPALSDTGALFNATATTTAGGHANLLTTALSHAAFSAARIAMRKQTDQPLGVGRKLLIEPKYLLVPVDLETTATDIRNSELVPEANGASTTGNQTRNAFAGKFEVIVVPDWTDTNNWALAADPRQFPAIYTIFPRGGRTPQLFTSDQETQGSMFTNDALRYKVRMLTYRFSSTYECAPVADFRPLHKSNVA